MSSFGDSSIHAAARSTRVIAGSTGVVRCRSLFGGTSHRKRGRPAWLPNDTTFAKTSKNGHWWTESESQIVISCVNHGIAWSQIADELGLPIGTVQEHIRYLREPEVGKLPSAAAPDAVPHAIWTPVLQQDPTAADTREATRGQYQRD